MSDAVATAADRAACRQTLERMQVGMEPKRFHSNVSRLIKSFPDSR